MSYLKREKASIHYKYLSSENPQAETIVLSHGLGLNMETWNYLVAELLDYNFLLFDFRGHGKTIAEVNGLTWDILYEDFTALLRHLNIENYHFIGHGLGGYFGIELFGVYGEKAKSLTLIGITSIVPDEIGREIITYRQRFSKPETYKALGDFMIPQILHRKSPEKYNLLYDAYNQVDHEVYFRLMDLIVQSLSLTKLQTIDIPTLVLGGECDPNYLPTFVTMNSHYLPQGRTAIIIDASNMVQIDHPEIVARIFQQFIETKNNTINKNLHHSKLWENYFKEISKSPSEKISTLNKSLVINLVHNFEVIYIGESVSGHWNRRNAKELLAFFAVNPMVSRERLFEVFWPHLPLPNAQNQLRVALSHLRKILADAGLTNAITTNKKELQLNVDYHCDAIQLEALFKKATATNDHSLLRSTILQILEYFKRNLELFPDLYSDWILDYKLYIEEQIIYLFTRSYPQFIKQKEYILAKQMIEILLKIKPFNQSLKQDLYYVNDKIDHAYNEKDN